jgi:hypothetical protein
VRAQRGNLRSAAPTAERQGRTTLVAGEPAHHGTTARGVYARACSAGEPEQGNELDGIRHERSRADERAHQRQPDREDDPLADPVGCDAPGEQGEHRTNPDAGQDNPNLGDAEVELGAKRRSKNRQAEKDRGEARLGRCPRGEHDPSVASRYGPIGSNDSGPRSIMEHP